MQQGSTARHLPYLWDDYRSWADDRRWEIIAGEAYAMSPAPSTRHQSIQLELAVQFRNRLDGRPCKPFISPVDVKLDELNVVQPDLVVVCRPEQIKSTHIEGAPALVVEILSPSTAQRDRGVKMDAYARAGVQEVWLVTPWPQCVEVYILDHDSYRRHGAFTQLHTLNSPTLPALMVTLAAVFDFPLEPGEIPAEATPVPASGGRRRAQCRKPA